MQVTDKFFKGLLIAIPISVLLWWAIVKGALWLLINGYI